MAGLNYLFFTIKMTTEIGSNGITIRVKPFYASNISFEDIESCEARNYKPLAEYGGWGIRIGFKSKAFNVFGNHGVQLKLSNGRSLLIGSQKAEELAQVILAFLLVRAESLTTRTS